MPKQRTAFRNRAEEAVVRLLLERVASRTPEEAEAAGRQLGRAAWRLLAGRRRLAERNMGRAFPERTPADVAASVREVFAHFGGVAGALLRLLDEPAEAIASRVEVAFEERAREAVARGRGAFFLTPHLGNWELAAFVAAFRGLPMRVVARPLDNPLLEARLRAFRERSGNVVVPKAEAAREILRTFRRGGIVGILPDQHAHPPDAVVAPFFGRPASTTTAVARLSERTGAVIVPAFCARTGPARWRLEFLPPLDPLDLPPDGREVAPFTARVNAIVEAMVRRHPEQWLWLHNRWRHD